MYEVLLGRQDTLWISQEQFKEAKELLGYSKEKLMVLSEKLAPVHSRAYDAIVEGTEVPAPTQSRSSKGIDYAQIGAFSEHIDYVERCFLLFEALGISFRADGQPILAATTLQDRKEEVASNVVPKNFLLFLGALGLSAEHLSDALYKVAMLREHKFNYEKPILRRMLVKSLGDPHE